MQRRVERTFFDLELRVRRVFDPAHHGEAVHRSPGERLEDQEIQRAADEIELRCGHIRRCEMEPLPRSLRFLGLDTRFYQTV